MGNHSGKPQWKTTWETTVRNHSGKPQWETTVGNHCGKPEWETLKKTLKPGFVTF